jgi:hypothetical protein
VDTIARCGEDIAELLERIPCDDAVEIIPVFKAKVALADAAATARSAVAFAGGSINPANPGTSRRLRFASSAIGTM